jgi:serine/threonine-protein kinase
MPPVEASTVPVRNELEKILASSEFLRNERLSRFLRFIVEQQLAGKAAELKESLVGIEVFGRAPGFDPRQDSVVRTEAARLRVRLSQYYAGEGAGDSVVIELPKGGYAPVFREVEAPREIRRSLRSRLGTRLWLAPALIGLTATLAALGWWWVQHKNAPIAIAVLPLINQNQDTGKDDYFADGLTNEIIRNLSIIEGLVVRSQTSSFAFKGKPPNVREAGRQLGADYILEGSVLRAGQKLRINAHLIRVRDDFPLWTGKYDKELTDIFAIQDEISRGIVNSLRLKLGRGRRRYETSIEAYDLYLHARAQQIRAGLSGFDSRASSADQMIGLLEEAIVKDPAFAPAYAGLASAHAARSGNFSSEIGDELTKMRAAAGKAIQLDPLLAEAHDALGMAGARDGQWEESEKSFRRAIELDPGRSEFYRHFATFLLMPLGRIEEALQQLRVAGEDDPLSSEVRFYLAYVLISAGRYEEAADQCEKLPTHSAGKPLLMGRARLGQGRTQEAIRIFETDLNRGVKPGSEVWGELGYAYARAGRLKEAEKLAAATPSRNPLNRALIFAGLRDKSRTFEALDQAVAAGPVRVGRALTFPEMSLLHGDPRLKALRKKVGLPD